MSINALADTESMRPAEGVATTDFPAGQGTFTLVIPMRGATADGKQQALHVSHTAAELIGDKLQGMGRVNLDELNLVHHFHQKGQTLKLVTCNANNMESIDDQFGYPGKIGKTCTGFGDMTETTTKVAILGFTSRQIQPVSGQDPMFRIKIHADAGVEVALRFTLSYEGFIMSRPLVF